jgi:peptidyl-prolyl cis-trans isomerase C
MRLAAEWLGPDDRPSGDQLEAYLAAHAADFAEPARMRLTQVFLSSDVHGGALEADARALLAALSRGPTPPEEAVSRGDAFIRGATFDATRAELERTFGAELAAGVEAAPAGRWVGPLRSGYGLHLVWVHGRQPGRTPPLAEVRGRVAQAWLRERREQREREALEEMRSRYLVAVEAR